MSSKPMLSEERAQDSSDDEESSGPEVDQTPRHGSGNAEKGSKTKPSNRDILTNGLSDTDSNESDNDSDDTETSSKSSSSSTSTSSKRKAKQRPAETTESPNKKAKTTTAASQSKNGGTTSHNLANVKRVESTSYTPPQGYTANKMQSSETPAQAKALFEDLSGKQIWHISAPSSFPISKLDSLDVQAALEGESILQHKGIAYTMINEDVGAAALLTPKLNGDYVHTASVARTLKIVGKSDPTKESGTENSQGDESSQRQNDLAGLTKPSTFFATRPGHQKVPRKQPENLKARYVPFGVVESTWIDQGGEDVSDQDVTMADVAPVEPLRSSEATPRSSKKAKTKETSSSQIEVNESPAKRRKDKHVKSSQGDTVIPDSSQKKKRREKKSETT